ncbi:U-box domain-containing protein 9-like [Primulina huaijiensis]|uniref:U-box domain-containing protein 9-like n=1 Tax=Primulina huaijiensis TaxID=1492673 RepID=UPI003CC7029D
MAEKGGGAKGATELKKELQRLVEAIVEEDESDDYYGLEVTDHAIRTLFLLRNSKSNPPQESEKLKDLYGLSEDSEGVPVEFRCPISGLLFKEPVVLASGQTYDQPFIQKWLKDGHQTCPRTNQLLPHTVLIPNLSIKNMVVKWCKLHNCEVPCRIIDNDQENPAHKNSDHLVELLEKLSSSSLSDAKSAGKELRMLTNRFPSFKALFADVSHAIPQLFNPILLEGIYSDDDFREDFVATILNISIHDIDVMNMVSEIPSAVSLVIESLKVNRAEIKSHAAAVLSLLSALDSKKHELGKLGIVKLLIDLLEEGHPLVSKDAALALKNLCTVVENREKAISDGAIAVLMCKIRGSILTDEMLKILAKLSSHHKAIEQIEEHGGIVHFFNILMDNTDEHNKETCVAILYTMCYNDRRKLREIRGVENACEILNQVAQTGTSRAKRKASGILERMHKFAFVSHTT